MIVFAQMGNIEGVSTSVSVPSINKLIAIHDFIWSNGRIWEKYL